MLEARVLVAVLGTLRPPGKSMSEESGVVGLETNEGRSSDVSEGEGGNGVGGLL